MASLTYSQAGVNIEAADQFVASVLKLAKATHTKDVKHSKGGYASLYKVSGDKWIAASTDGVGTKLKLAIELGRHDTIGIDLVAMCVNDLICVGATPLFFLDYFATGRLEPLVGTQVLRGIVNGCGQAECALVGGETAEMPSMYAESDYDLAGFSVGLLDPKKLLPKERFKKGDLLIGLRSSGFHSNGYSLLRKLLPDGEGRTKLATDLLTPTRIYVKSVLPLIKKRLIKGAAHITGGGLTNLLRLNDQVEFQVNLPSETERPEIMNWIFKKSELPSLELAKTFNMGVGMVLIVSEKNLSKVVSNLKKTNEEFFMFGRIWDESPGKIRVQEDEGTFYLE